MSLADRVHIEKCALEFVDYEEASLKSIYYLSDLDVSFTPVGTEYELIEDGELVSTLKGYRANFQLSASHLEAHADSDGNPDFVTLVAYAYLYIQPGYSIYFYPDWSLQPSGKIEVMPVLNRPIDIERIRQGTRTLGGSLNFNSKKLVTATELSFYRRY